MPQIDINNPGGGLPGGMIIDINNIPSIRDIGKKPEEQKDDDTAPKRPPCPNCGKHHFPFLP